MIHRQGGKYRVIRKALLRLLLLHFPGRREAPEEMRRTGKIVGHCHRV